MTKPTKLQEKGCDQLAEALLLITEAARLDGKAAFNNADLRELAGCLTRASSAFGLDVIVSRALERRGKLLGLRSGTSELLMLVDSDALPLNALALSDDDFLARVNAVELELGEV